MRSALAWVVYMLGLVLGLDVLVSGLVAEGLWNALGGIAFAAGVWWIAAGIGTRLGETRTTSSPQSALYSASAIVPKRRPSPPARRDAPSRKLPTALGPKGKPPTHLDSQS
jgi:hypothetical protein